MHQSLTRLLTGMLMLATILMVWNQVAMAALVVRETTLEMRTGDVPLWQLNIGRLAVRRCADCPVSWLRVDEATRYQVYAAGDVSQEQFVQQAKDPAGRQGVITLFLEPDADYVRRLYLSPARGN
ncbi:MAG: hypothetical protein JSV45_02905 [Chromatiales bacterium]|nr:MAG: hypothetical protein JSV45_02905 [Chromatiales bacterium]